MIDLLTEATPLEALLAWTEKFSAEWDLGLAIFCEGSPEGSKWTLFASWEEPSSSNDGEGHWRVAVYADNLRSLLVQAAPKLLAEV